MIRDHQKNNLFSSHFIKLEPKNHVFGTKRRKTKQQRDKTSQESVLKQKKFHNPRESGTESKKENSNLIRTTKQEDGKINKRELRRKGARFSPTTAAEEKAPTRGRSEAAAKDEAKVGGRR